MSNWPCGERELVDVALRDAMPGRLRTIDLVRLDGGTQVGRSDDGGRRREQHFGEPAGAAAGLEDMNRLRLLESAPERFAEAAPQPVLRVARAGV